MATTNEKNAGNRETPENTACWKTWVIAMKTPKQQDFSFIGKRLDRQNEAIYLHCVN